MPWVKANIMQGLTNFLHGDAEQNVAMLLVLFANLNVMHCVWKGFLISAKILYFVINTRVQYKGPVSIASLHHNPILYHSKWIIFLARFLQMFYSLCQEQYESYDSLKLQWIKVTHGFAGTNNHKFAGQTLLVVYVQSQRLKISFRISSMLST